MKHRGLAGRTGSSASVVILCILLGGVASAGMYEAGEAVVPAASAPIKLDGKLDDAAWAKTPRVGPLLVAASMVKPNHDFTYLRLLHDAKALYLAVRVAAPPSKAAEKFPRDSRPPFRKDHIELVLDPTPDTKSSYFFAFDRHGNIADGRYGTEFPEPTGRAWNGRWDIVIAEAKGGWTAELRLPYKTLGVKSVKPADLWRLRIGRIHGRDGFVQWPPNPTGLFNNRVSDAALYFDRMNRIEDGEFESGAAKLDLTTRPWCAHLSSKKFGGRHQGTVEIVRGGVAPGKWALRIFKEPWAQFRPYVSHMRDISVRGGGVYEISVMSKGGMPLFTIGVSFYGVDPKTKKPRGGWAGQGDGPGQEFHRTRFRFVIPTWGQKARLGMSSGRARGEITYDNVVLRRVLVADTEARARAKLYYSGVAKFEPTPGPIQGLEALCERGGPKPWKWFWRKDGYLTYRVMFRDRKYGTWIWMLDKSDMFESSGSASIFTPWNADGSLIHMPQRRPVFKHKAGPPAASGATKATVAWRAGSQKRWLANGDFSRLKPQVAGSYPIWDLKDPDVFYYLYRSRGEIMKINARTGKVRILARIKPRRPKMLGKTYGLTKDNRSLFVLDAEGGQWMYFTPGDKPMPHITGVDCYGFAPGADGTKRFPDSGMVGWYKGKPIFRVMIGARVYTDTGRTERVIVPMSGNMDYLKTFISGRVQFPTHAALPKTKDLNELFNIYHLYPSTSHGHTGYSPDGEYMSWDGSAAGYTRVRDNRRMHSPRPSANAGTYHSCWYRDPRFYVTGTAGHLRSYARGHNGGLICQIFTDGTWVPVCDIKKRLASHYQGGHMAILSHDATKVHYTTSMIHGLMKCYIAVMARPQPPRNVSWRAEGAAVALKWDAPPLHQEIMGYLVYRSDRSGDGYALRTPKPVVGVTWRDTTVKQGRPYFYVVTGVARDGLESGYSAEAAGAGVGLAHPVAAPLIVYAEAERALVDLKTEDMPGVSRGRDANGASDWYYVYRHPHVVKGVAMLPVRIPADGAYVVWLRVRRNGKEDAAWAVAADKKALGKAKCANNGWTWVRVTKRPVALKAGRRLVTLATSDKGAQADLLCLATDPAFTPKGVRPEDRVAPGPVRGLRHVETRGRATQIKWAPSAEPDFWHYNVYGSRKPMAKPTQETLLASPTYCEFIDWGLRAGATYHYAVTAVDRRGNESPLSAGVKVAIAPRTHPAQAWELRFDQAKLSGPFQRAKAKGTHAPEYVILPGDTPKSEDLSASWEIDVKRATRLYVWLRYLPRGQAARRASAVRMLMPVRLDGRVVMPYVGAYRTDLSVENKDIRPGLWTWARPAYPSCKFYSFPASKGRHTLTLKNLTPGVRFDILYVTDEPSFWPTDGRMKQSL